MNNRALLKIGSLSAGYEGRAVVRDVDVTVCAGEILVLIGPNGSGKSTLIKTVSGQLAPVSGDVRLGQESVFSMDPMERARHLSLLLTGERSKELMTCREVVEMGRYPYTGRLGILAPEDEAVVTESMEKLDISALSDTLFDRISDGQRQRVLLARALCQKPKILILDEPASYLDIKYQLELLDILQALSAEGLAVIMSMHDLYLVKRIAHRLLCIKDGGARAVEDVTGFYESGGIEELFDIEGSVAYGAQI